MDRGPSPVEWSRRRVAPATTVDPDRSVNRIVTTLRTAAAASGARVVADGRPARIAEPGPVRERGAAGSAAGRQPGAAARAEGGAFPVDPPAPPTRHALTSPFPGGSVREPRPVYGRRKGMKARSLSLLGSRSLALSARRVRKADDHDERRQPADATRPTRPRCSCASTSAAASCRSRRSSRACPQMSIYGDGTVITQGPQIAIYPGPVVPNLLVRKLDEAGHARRCSQTAVDAGLVGPAPDYGQPPIADVPDTVVTINVNGKTLRAPRERARATSAAATWASRRRKLDARKALAGFVTSIDATSRRSSAASTSAPRSPTTITGWRLRATVADSAAHRRARADRRCRGRSPSLAARVDR